MRVKPLASRRRTAIRRTTSQSMPVSSCTSLTATSAGVPDIGPTGRIEPGPAVGPLHEQDLARVVVDDSTDGRLGRDVAGNAVADELHPLAHDVVGRVQPFGRSPDLARHCEYFFESLALVQALREPQPRASDGRQRLTPAQQVAFGEWAFAFLGHGTRVAQSHRSAVSA